MTTVRSTRACMATPRVLFALETAGAPYQLVVHPDGWFLDTHGRPGPVLEEGAVRRFEADEILRHLAAAHPRQLHPDGAEPWLVLAWDRLRPILRRLASDPAAARTDLLAVLAELEAALADRDWLTGTLGVADVAFLHVGAFERFGLSLAGHPRVQAWQARLRAQPAWVRTQARLATVS